MPKMKTNKATSKRVSFTGTGKIKRNRMNKRHLLNSKSSKRKARLRKPTLVDGTNMAAVKKMLPYGN